MTTSKQLLGVNLDGNNGHLGVPCLGDVEEEVWRLRTRIDHHIRSGILENLSSDLCCRHGMIIAKGNNRRTYMTGEMTRFNIHFRRIWVG